MIKALFLFAAIYGGGAVFIVTWLIGRRMLSPYRLVGHPAVGRHVRAYPPDEEA